MCNALQALELWLVELANEGRASGTLRAYASDVQAVLGQCAAATTKLPDQLELVDVSRDALVAAIAHFRGSQDARYSANPHLAPSTRAPATIGRRVAAVRAFFAWAYATGRVTGDPAATLRSPKHNKRLPKALEIAAAQAALDVAGESRWPERDEAILALALTSGLRLQELATLKLDDLVGKPPEALSVIGKGDKERRLPLAPLAQAAIVAYLPTRAGRLEEVGLTARTLLISSRPRQVGTPSHGKPVMTMETSGAGVAYVVDRVLAAIGARRRGSRVHVLRHTFATLGLRPDPATGQPAYTLRELQAALGHANLATIQVYAEVSDPELIRAARAHPLAGIG